MRAKGRDLKPIPYEEREDIPLLIQRGQVRIVLRKHQQRPAVHVQKIGIACAERPRQTKMRALTTTANGRVPGI